MPIGQTVDQPSSLAHATAARRRTSATVLMLVLIVSLLSGPATAQEVPTGDPATNELTDEGGAERTEEEARILTDTLALAPANAPASPDDVFVAVIDAKKAADDALVVRLTTEMNATKAREVAFVAVIALGDAEKARTAAAVALRKAKADLVAERKRLSDLTVRAYVSGGDTSGEDLRAIVEGDTSDPSKGRTVIFEQVLQGQQKTVETARVDARKAQAALVAATGKRDRASKESDVQSQRARRQAQVRDQSELALVAARNTQDAAEARVRSGRTGQMVPEGVPIIGMPRLSAQDLATWFETSPYESRVPTPIIDYAEWFIAEGAAEGIRGDIAFAQAVLETGGFTNTDSVFANNFSGIGHCDTCAAGWLFPSPQAGVRAQIQLLKSYAIARPEYVNDLVDRRLRGPAGCCETWADLTTVWATDPGYGPKVMFLYSSMVNHSLGRRAAGQGFDDPPPLAPEPTD